MTIVDVPMRHLWKGVLSAGIISLVLGLVVLLWPGMSITVAAILFGAYLVVSGIAEVLFAFSLHSSVPHRVLLFITGALSVIVGILAFRHFGEGFAVLLLAIWIGVGFVFQGVALAAMAIGYPQLPGRKWNLFFGVMSMIAGVVALGWPFSSIVVLAIVVGACLIVLGIVQIITALTVRRDLNALDGQSAETFGGSSAMAR
ncbi:MAG: hypothetical protein JWR11_5990 [Mycobacterium sp.]|jgi:uncharacterized membrane protein HdeD (DUF308 family)|nr:hypothetical protein [Mycobacterium sp.]MDT5179676.1 hypothetical protein [Mycobacterium sp.]